jgi:hypothetical protein
LNFFPTENDVQPKLNSITAVIILRRRSFYSHELQTYHRKVTLAALVGLYFFKKRNDDSARQIKMGGVVRRQHLNVFTTKYGKIAARQRLPPRTVGDARLLT